MQADSVLKDNMWMFAKIYVPMHATTIYVN